MKQYLDFSFPKPYIARKAQDEIIQFTFLYKSLNYLLLHTSYRKQSSLSIILQTDNNRSATPLNFLGQVKLVLLKKLTNQISAVREL